MLGFEHYIIELKRNHLLVSVESLRKPTIKYLQAHQKGRQNVQM